MRDNKDIDFIATHYRKGRFEVGDGWKRLGIGHGYGFRRLYAAAAIGGIIFLSAAAAVVYNKYAHDSDVNIESGQSQTVTPLYAVKVIDFENAPLSEVVNRIEDVYGVEIVNIPADSGVYNLSLHYEGNAADLVESINDILGIEMTIKE